MMINFSDSICKEKNNKRIISVSLNCNKRVLEMGWVIYCFAVDIASISSKSMKRRSMMIFLFINAPCARPT